MNPNDSPILEIANAAKTFRSGASQVTALSDVTLTARRGEFVAVMGASGSGKSTLLNLAAGLTRPDSGRIRIAGTDINALGDGAMTLFRRKHIGLVFQAFNLIPSLSGEDNIALPLLLGGVPRDTDHIDNLVRRLGLGEVRCRQPDSMSGGEQQRVAIGRALVTKPPLVLADEPTGSLDTSNGRKLCDLFRELCQENGTTVLMVTHNPAAAFAAERFVILRDGHLVGTLDKTACPTVRDLNHAYMEILEGETQGARP